MRIKFNNMNYFLMSQRMDNRSSILQNCLWMLDLEDLYSIISTIHSYFAWSTNRENHLTIHKVPDNLVGWIVMMEDLFIHFIQIHSILSIIVIRESWNAPLPNVIDFRFGRSDHSNIQYQINTFNFK